MVSAKDKEFDMGWKAGLVDKKAGVTKTPPDKRWLDGDSGLYPGTAMQSDRPYWQGYFGAQNEHLIWEGPQNSVREDLLEKTLMIIEKDLDPIPGAFLQKALEELVTIEVIPTSTNNRGHTWLAEQLDVTVSTVWRWCSGKRALKGPTAMAVRHVLEKSIASF